MLEKDCEKIEKLTKYLDFQTSYKRSNIYENFGQGRGLPPLSEIESPKLDTNPLPNHLRYEFLEKIALYG